MALAVSGIALVTAAAARHIPPQRGPAAADLAPASCMRHRHWSPDWTLEKLGTDSSLSATNTDTETGL